MSLRFGVVGSCKQLITIGYRATRRKRHAPEPRRSVTKMETRKLYVGVSSPVGYSYLTESQQGKPCPILEAPLSYLLLYDEIWFLTRRLCPFDLENLEFVHFVDEELRPEGIAKDELPALGDRQLPSWDWPTWETHVDRILGNHREWRCDNSGRPFKYGEILLRPTPGSAENLLFDKFLCSQYGMDLAENTPNAVANSVFDEELLKLTLSQRLLATRIPSLYSLQGPWHPVIADIRSDPFLKDFRRKIQSSQGLENLESVDEKLRDLCREYEKQVRKSVVQRFSTADIYYSTASFILGFVPVVGEIVSTTEWGRNLIQKIRTRGQVRSWLLTHEVRSTTRC